MQQQPFLKLLVISISLLGLTTLTFLQTEPSQTSVTIEQLAVIRSTTRVTFVAKVEEWKTFQYHNRIQLFDGNTTTAILPSQNPWKPRHGIFRFTAWVIAQKPHNRIEIEEAKPID